MEYNRVWLALMFLRQFLCNQLQRSLYLSWGQEYTYVLVAEKNYIMPASFYKQVVFNCHANSALANYFWKERGFFETQDDIWSSAIEEMWFNWGILCMTRYTVWLWVRKRSVETLEWKPVGTECITVLTHRLVQYVEFTITSFRLQHHFSTTGTATSHRYLFSFESQCFSEEI